VLFVLFVVVVAGVDVGHRSFLMSLIARQIVLGQ